MESLNRDKIIGLDTSSTGISIALSDGISVKGEISIYSDKPSGDQIIKFLDDLLLKTDFKIDDIKGIILTTGPGSFTGLRVGLSFAKAFSLSKTIELKGINSLYALACSVKYIKKNILVVQDAKKNEVYASLFKSNGFILEEILKTSTYKFEYLVNSIPEDDCIVIGEGSRLVKDKLDLCEHLFFLDNPCYNYPSSSQLTTLWDDPFALTLDPSTITPDYYRISQAEEINKSS